MTAPIREPLDELEQPRTQIAAALEGLELWQARTILNGMVTYGWKRPNGEWQPSPFYHPHDYRRD